jgi:hypothetical protein
MKMFHRKKTKLVLDELRYSVGKLELRPDDVIVAKTDMLLDAEQTVAIRDRLYNHLRDAGIENKVLILTGNMDIAVLRKEPIK